MEPKFKCLNCGKERYHSRTPQSVTVKGKLYFKDTGNYLNLNHTFCNLKCLLEFIAEWDVLAHEEQYD